MMAAIRNILVLFAITLLIIVGIGLYRQYNGEAGVAENQTQPIGEQVGAAVDSDIAVVPDEAEADSTNMVTETPSESGPDTADEAADEGVIVQVPEEPEAEYFALSVKMIDQGVVEIKSRREDGDDKRYFVHLVTCATLRTGVVAESTDLAGLAERNETPDMVIPSEGTAELTLSRIACASVEN